MLDRLKVVFRDLINFFLLDVMVEIKILIILFMGMVGDRELDEVFNIIFKYYNNIFILYCVL